MSESDQLVAGRYRLLELIGTGGMGAVWRAHDERLGRDVAVKRLHSRTSVADAEADVAAQRAMREARITARLHHPHAVPVFDVVEHEGQPCLVMQYFPSESLADLVTGPRAVSVSEVARIGGEVASALAVAHGVGIVHRDVKPGNVLVSADGTAKISDFGIAHALGDVSLTSTGFVTGTPAYLAPEVARGEDSSPASDVFSLGSTLYTALEGRPPFGNLENSMALLHRVAAGDIEPPRRSGPLTPLLLRMLAARPEDRPTMDDVARGLRELDTGELDAGELDTGEPVAAAGTATGPSAAPAHDDLLASFRGPPTEPWEHPEHGDDRRGRRTLLVVLALTAGVAALVLAVALRQGEEPTTASPVRSATGSSRPSSTADPGTATPSAAATSSAPAPSATSPTPTATPTPTTAPPPGATPPANALASAVRDYYALLPGDVDAGWERLTERYQRTTARNREYYTSFWGAVDRVRVSDVSASGPGQVTATLTYEYEDGRVFVERTSYGLVEDDDVLKIDRSTVLSSTQR